jgi:hypothetical protein
MGERSGSQSLICPVCGSPSIANLSWPEESGPTNMPVVDSYLCLHGCTPANTDILRQIIRGRSSEPVTQPRIDA